MAEAECIQCECGGGECVCECECELQELKRSVPHERPQFRDAHSEYTDRPNKIGYSVLHTAIDQNEVALLSNLLKQKNIDLNVQNIYNETPLMMSIRRNDPTSTIMQLIEAGCDFNIADCTGKTPLHMAIYHENLDIARELIKRGANIDACSWNGNSSLFYAIISRNVEMICMLLYYCVDVSIQNKEGLTAFTYAMRYRRNRCTCEDCRSLASLLIPYYDDFSYTDKDGCSPLYIAFEFHYELVFQLLDAGADVNGIINNSGECCFEKWQGISTNILKKIMPKLDYNILVNIRRPFLDTYFGAIFYPQLEWLEILYLILDRPVASDLLQHLLQYNSESLSYELMHTLYDWQIETNHRTNIISICLTLGVEAKITMLDAAIRFYGFKEEFEMLLYAASNFIGFEYITHPLLLFILGIKDFNRKIAIRLMKYQIKCRGKNIRSVTINNTLKIFPIHICIIENAIISSLNFFSIPHTAKQELISVCQLHSDTRYDYLWIIDMINGVPEFPSLFELSRNKVHQFIRQTHEIKRPYHFMDAVKRLPLPQYIKDAILFRKPIYL